MNNQPYIRVFTKPDCPFCVQAKDLLSAKGFSYSEFELGKDLTREEFIEKFPDVKTVPYIIVGNNHVGGYKQLLEMIGDF
jgi:glutaredoxin